jgi:hypothetical protein
MYPVNLPFKASMLATTIALTACGGDSSSSAPANLASNALGTSIISVKGGDANYQAGNGGEIDINKRYSAAPLNVTVNGLPDTRYEQPEITANLGPNPVEISTTTTISFADPSLQSGDLYLANDRMYRYDGTVDSNQDPIFTKKNTVITGLKITSDAILTLDFNISNGALYFLNDIQNDGEITLAAQDMPEDTGNLDLFPFNYLGLGSINLAGKVTGQTSGRLRILANIVQNSGAINTSGADGDATTPGGESGDVYIASTTLNENNGTIIANSGSSTGAATSTTSDTSYIDLYSVRDLVNSGSINASAGSGVNSSTHYDGGDIQLMANNLLLNTGSLTTNGSNAILNAAETNGGEGGHGGDIGIFLSGEGAGAAFATPRLVNTGSLQANGGNSADDDYIAGNGGGITIGVSEGLTNGDRVRINPAIMTISGNLIAEGGNTTETSDTGEATGGEGGVVTINHDSQLLSEFATQIVGYESLGASGGNGHRSGDGGTIRIEGKSNSGEQAETYAPAPSIDVVSSLIINGGEVVASSTLTQSAIAGDGGDAYVTTDTQHEYLQKKLTVSFDGSVSSNANDVSNASSAGGGYFYASSPQTLIISGDISLNGGNDVAIPEIGESDGFNSGGPGGYMALTSEFGNVDFNAQASVNGGAGQIDGGDGGVVMINSATASKVSGSISLTGGNASASNINEEETDGGDGGVLRVISNDQRTNLRASYTLTPGTGVNTGIIGGAFVDTNCIDGICQNVTFFGFGPT